MIQLSGNVDWTGTVLWLAGVALAGFLVPWVLTDLLRIRRTAYVGLLAVATAALTAGYLFWSGIGAEFWTNAWAWGILGAALAAALLAAALQRLHDIPRLTKRAGVLTVLWEGGVYGVAEGVLLSALPVAIVWAGMSAAGWTSGIAVVGAGAAGLLASIVVIAVHHLGYAGYRSKRIAQPVLACGALSVAYLVSGSLIAPVLGHMLLHGAILRRGIEMPPEEFPARFAPPRVVKAA